MLAITAGAGLGHSDPVLPYGPETCKAGYVWREARDGDTVCVFPSTRARTAQENANPTLNREPGGGAYGPDTCMQGFVWREAFDGDTICVTPDVRRITRFDNSEDYWRKETTPPRTGG